MLALCIRLRATKRFEQFVRNDQIEKHLREFIALLFGKMFEKSIQHLWFLFVGIFGNHLLKRNCLK